MKSTRDELLAEIADMLVIYAKSGKVGLNSFVQHLPHNIRDLEQLLTLHFLLKDEGKAFVRRLPLLLRKFQPTTVAHEKVGTEAVVGQINWQKTVQARAKRTDHDRSLFIYTEQTKAYSSKENLILKKAVQILYHILSTQLDAKTIHHYTWLTDWKTLQPIVYDIYRNNAYLARIDDQTPVTERMIQATLRHRNPLYREAANLVAHYERIRHNQMEQAEIVKLLAETFIAPEREEVLFELYWALQMIKWHAPHAELIPLTSEQHQVASWQDETHIYSLFHNASGSGELSWQVSLAEIAESEHPYLQRKLESVQMYQQLAEPFFGKEKSRHLLWNGRPDIVVEVREQETGKLVKVIVCEVKYTSDREYALTGLRELVDYICLLKNQLGHYLYQNQEQGVAVEGILFLDRLAVPLVSASAIQVITRETL